jgi:hypothetical protein
MKRVGGQEGCRKTREYAGKEEMERGYGKDRNRYRMVREKVGSEMRWERKCRILYEGVSKSFRFESITK